MFHSCTLPFLLFRSNCSLNTGPQMQLLPLYRNSGKDTVEVSQYITNIVARNLHKRQIKQLKDEEDAY